MPSPKHDIQFIVGKDGSVAATIYTYGDDPYFEMEFASMDEVADWHRQIGNEMARAISDRATEDEMDEQIAEIVKEANRCSTG